MAKQEMIGRPVKKDERDAIIQEKHEMWLKRKEMRLKRLDLSKAPEQF